MTALLIKLWRTHIGALNHNWPNMNYYSIFSILIFVTGILFYFCFALELLFKNMNLDETSFSNTFLKIIL